MKKDVLESINKNGNFLSSELFSLRFIYPSKEKALFIVISKKVSPKAVLRNKIRRRIRYSLDKNLDPRKKNKTQLSIFVKKDIIGKDFNEIDRQILKTLEKAKLNKK